MKRKIETIVDRNGKGVVMRKIRDIEYSAYVPNVHTYKSVQVKICGWITPDPTADQEFYNKQIFLATHRIRNVIREWSKTTGHFHQECIIDFDMSSIIAKHKIKTHQFIKIDVGLFTKPGMGFDKEYVKESVEDISNLIVNKLEETPVTWNFINYQNHNKRLKSLRLNEQS